MNMRLITALLVTLSCLVGLAACAEPGAADTAFPTTDASTWPEGSFPNTENLSKVAPGMTKHQLYELIGPPHFHESVFRVRVWNYLFHFRTADGIANCQYQVQFDDKSRVASSRWEDQACEKYSGARNSAVDKNAAKPLTLNDLD
ncbi:outer membrane protein assembly factor BamE [Paraburkholderia strydomiana]|uniref:outer membrane protein assembly factor BamE n=1 Tax=Paraburkholderia strydomiana TaxID=1245417 RepID=UPI0038B9F269